MIDARSLDGDIGTQATEAVAVKIQTPDRMGLFPVVHTDGAVMSLLPAPNNRGKSASGLPSVAAHGPPSAAGAGCMDAGQSGGMFPSASRCKPSGTPCPKQDFDSGSEIFPTMMGKLTPFAALSTTWCDAQVWQK